MQLVFTIFPKVIDVQTNVRYNQVIRFFCSKLQLLTHFTTFSGKSKTVLLTFSETASLRVFRFIAKSKLKRNDDSRMTMNVLTASVSGEDISDPASDSKIAKVLGLKPRRVIAGDDSM
jgi:hypothetical protein